ncbi:hypothetical protein A2Y85_00280 [candidate division WOR-3 bacterium RBG_13_43_14]|uniref:DUF4282 domain-containing protein n=1 Tax=candidate division WOR-3 bacterium RBG_13_43_14 TaxID=1802590 RepID=A0A1F4U2Y4_UNCW3|nr:MAG: hypothetical protein A2Y85_00280 [candidate division WOR-3 bacterium RBG_13_43_14]
MEKKFTALRTISVIFKVIAWIIAAFTIIGFFGMLVGGAALSQLGRQYGSQFNMMGPMWGVLMAFYLLIVGAISFISFLAGAEMIMVFLAIEENTRAVRPQA